MKNRPCRICCLVRAVFILSIKNSYRHIFILTSKKTVDRFLFFCYNKKIEEREER
nr:MAG TPA: hypothetical protein [Caudoviricetes sp.]